VFLLGGVFEPCLFGNTVTAAAPKVPSLPACSDVVAEFPRSGWPAQGKGSRTWMSGMRRLC
jgi:hypothetical protein